MLLVIAGVFAGIAATGARGTVPGAESSEAWLDGGADIFDGLTPAPGHITAGFFKGDESYGGNATTTTVTFTLPKGVTVSGVELLPTDFEPCAEPTAITARGNQVKFQIACDTEQGFIWAADVASRLREGSYNVTAEFKVDSTKRVKSGPNMWQILMPGAFVVPVYQAPLVKAEPDDYGFGDVQIAESTSHWVDITFTNNSTSTVHLNGSELSPETPFAIGGSGLYSCTLGIDPGEKCSTQIGFGPTEPGYYETSFTTTWLDSENVTVATTVVLLSGTGVDSSPSNSPPTNTWGWSVHTFQDTAATVRLRATDANSDPLSFEIVQSPAHGTFGAIGTPNCGGSPWTCTADVVYTPNPGYTSDDSFSFRAYDRTAYSYEQFINIMVSPSPVGDAPYADNLSRSYGEVTQITLSGGDPNGDEITFAILTQPSHGTLGDIGPVICSPDISPYSSYSRCTATVIYTLTDPTYPPDQFTYQASDGTNLSNVATVSLQSS